VSQVQEWQSMSPVRRDGSECLLPLWRTYC